MYLVFLLKKASLKKYQFVSHVLLAHTLTRLGVVPVSSVQSITPLKPLGPPQEAAAYVGLGCIGIWLCFIGALSSAQPLLLECEASTSDGHVTVDCQTNRPPAMTVCSFDDGPEHHCRLHMWKKKKIFIYRTYFHI